MKQPALIIPDDVKFLPMPKTKLEEDFEKYMEQLKKDIAIGLLPTGVKKVCQCHGS